MNRRSLFWVVLIAIFAVATLNKVVRLDRPWTIRLDVVGAKYSNIARNFVRDGLWDPPLVQKMHHGSPPPPIAVPPLNAHPPLVPLAVALAFRIAGTDAPWAARLAILPASLLVALLIFLIARRTASTRVAMAALWFAALMPGAAFYGAWVDPVGWWSAAGILLCFLVFLPWVDSTTAPPAAWRGPALAAAFALAAMAEWNAVFVLPLLLIASAFANRQRRWWGIAWGIGAAALMYAVYRAILPGAVSGLAKLKKLATLSAFDGSFFATVGDHLVRLYGWPLLCLVAVGLAGLAWRAVRRSVDSFDVVIVLALGFQLWYTAAYPNAARVHDFCLVYTAPPFAWLAARAFLSIHEVVRSRAQVAGWLWLCAVLPWAGWVTSQALAGWAKYDAAVAPVERLARVVSAAIRPDEFVVTPYPHGELTSIAYHADRTIIGGITSAALLHRVETLLGRPAACVLPADEVARYPTLAARLARSDRANREGFFVFDLKNDPIEDAEPATLPAPDHIQARVQGSSLTIRWAPVEDPRVIAYRVAFGNAPGHYPVTFDVTEPCFERHRCPPGELRFIVRAIGKAGRRGRASGEQAASIIGAYDYSPHVLALAIVTIVLLLAQVTVMRRKPRSGRSATDPTDGCNGLRHQEH